MHDILITADNLSYKINENRLFSSVSFFLKKGECLHIKGSNGSGKSTLISLIGYEKSFKYAHKLKKKILINLKKHGKNAKDLISTVEFILERKF